MAKFFKRLRENPFGFEFHRALCQIKFGYTSAAWMPHVAYHGKDAVYGQQKTFVHFGSFQSGVLPAQNCLNI